MTVLQMSGADEEETNSPPPKKRRYSILKTEKRNSIEAWIKTSGTKSGIKTDFAEELYPMPAAHNAMVNEYGMSDTYSQPLIQRSPEESGYNDSIAPVVPLLNLGNTCFLNSVLYTLRFAPSFLHKLHHLSTTKQMNTIKTDKGCSLSRNLGKSGSWSNKDAFSYGTDCSNGKIQMVICKLHNLYATLCCNEFKDRMEPYQPNNFLQSLREVNPIFEGNQQHDAHELLVCLVDIIREACELIYQEKNTIDIPAAPQSVTPSKSSKVKTITRKLKNFTKKFQGSSSDGDIKKYLKNGNATGDTEDDSLYEEENYSVSQDTIFEDFRGVSLLRTTCLECEQVTERKETFCDICVPIQTISDCDDQIAVENLYRSIIVTEEYLIDNNKYWCEKCSRYNEARRCVKYESLPRLLTLHLKRFSSNFGTSVAKVNDHMPTPFTLSCFCEECLSIEQAEDRPHSYTLYGIIMHLGATIASGHYVAFVKTLDNSQEYLFCTRDKPKTSSLPRDTSNKTTSLNNSASSMSYKSQANGFCRYFSKLSSKSFNGSSAGSMNPSKELELRTRITPTCKGLECCTIRLRGLPTTDHDSNPVWLECDDETVRVLSTSELTDMLSLRSSKNNAVTPYLLFYSRVDS